MRCATCVSAAWVSLDRDIESVTSFSRKEVEFALLGTLEDALADAKALAKLPAGEEVEYLMLPEPINPLDRLLEGGLGIQSDVMSKLGAIPEAKVHLRAAEALLRMRADRAWLMMPYGVRVK